MIQGPVFSYRIVGQNRRHRETNLEEDSFDLLLLDRGGLPTEALDAPLASWVLARLTAEAGLGGAYADARQRSDGGAYSLVFEVTNAEGEKIAGFELLGYTWCVELLGTCDGAAPNKVVEDFAGLLLARPNELGRCRVSVFDNEWQEHPEDYDPRWPADTDRNIYGWNGTRFLGAENFWNAAEVEHPWPGENYRAYHERSLSAYRDAAQTEKLNTQEFSQMPDDELDDDDTTDDVVAEVRADLGRFLCDSESEAVLLRVYDLDGELTQDVEAPQDEVLAKVSAWVGQGFNAAWHRDGSTPVVKVWEYPASEPSWEVVLAGRNYEPDIRP